MAVKWSDVIKDPEYQSLTPAEKLQLQNRFWTNVVLKDPEYQSLTSTEKDALHSRFFKSSQQPTISTITPQQLKKAEAIRKASGYSQKTPIITFGTTPEITATTLVPKPTSKPIPKPIAKPIYQYTPKQIKTLQKQITFPTLPTRLPSSKEFKTIPNIPVGTKQLIIETPPTLEEYKEAVKIPFRIGKIAIEKAPILKDEEKKTLISYSKGLLEGGSAGHISPPKEEGESNLARGVGYLVGYALPIGKGIQLSKAIIGRLGVKTASPFLRRLSTEIVGMGAVGAIEKLPEDKSRLQNIIDWSALGAGFGLGARGLAKGGKLAKEYMFPESYRETMARAKGLPAEEVIKPTIKPMGETLGKKIDITIGEGKTPQETIGEELSKIAIKTKTPEKFKEATEGITFTISNANKTLTKTYIPEDIKKLVGEPETFWKEYHFGEKPELTPQQFKVREELKKRLAEKIKPKIKPTPEITPKIEVPPVEEVPPEAPPKVEVPPEVKMEVSEEVKPTPKEFAIKGNWELGQKRAFKFDLNSTINEGRFRLLPPEQIEKGTYFRRESTTPGVSYVMGKNIETGKSEIQAIRFDKSIMPEVKAKVWWDANKGKYKFAEGIKKIKPPEVPVSKVEPTTIETKPEIKPSSPKQTIKDTLKDLYIYEGRKKIGAVGKDISKIPLTPEEIEARERLVADVKRYTEEAHKSKKSFEKYLKEQGANKSLINLMQLALREEIKERPSEVFGKDIKGVSQEIKNTKKEIKELKKKALQEARFRYSEEKDLFETKKIIPQVIKRGGIRPYRLDTSGKIPEYEEYKSLPLVVKRKTGLPPDEMANELGLADDRELYDILRGEARIPKRQSFKYYKDLTEQELGLSELQERVVSLENKRKDLLRATKFERPGTKESLARITERVVKPPSKEIVIKEDVLLRQRIIDEARGAKEGANYARKLTREELLDKFRRSETTVKQLQKDIIDYVKSELPLSERGKFISAISQVKTKKQQLRIFEKVEEIKEKTIRKEKMEEIANMPKGRIDVTYQKEIVEVLKDIDLHKPTSKTLSRLRGMRDFIVRRGKEHRIPSEYTAKLSRLTKKNLVDMSTEELTELSETLKGLVNLGKLKQRLKYKYNARLRERELSKLLASTRNYDPTISNIATRGAKYMYLETLHTFRVAEVLDGYKRGMNFKYVRELGETETELKQEVMDMTLSALREIRETGIKELTEDQQVRMMINIRQREGAIEQVKTLMKYFKYEEIPKLTSQEEEAIKIIQKYTNKHTDEVAAVFEEIYNQIFPRMETYILPLKYPKENPVLSPDVLLHNRYRTTQTFKGFSIPRKPGVEELPRTDLLAIFEEALNEQLWFARMQPKLENLKYIVKHPKFREKVGRIGYNWWADHLDIMARKGWSASASFSPFTRLLRQGRININNAILGYKASSILMQPFVIFDALAYMSSAYNPLVIGRITKEFLQVWGDTLIRPGYVKKFINASPVLMQRNAGELAVEETLQEIGRMRGKYLWKSYQRGGLALLKWADLTSAVGIQNATLKILKKYKVPNPEKEAEFLTHLINSSAEVSYRPHILAKGEGMRTWFTFQTFFLNRWGILAHDLIRKGLIADPNWKKKFFALIGLGIYMAGNIAEDEARRNTYNIITGKEKEPESALTTALMTIPENIPFFGNLIKSAQWGIPSADIPIERVIKTGAVGTKQLIAGKKPEAKIRGAIKTTETELSLLGLAGTAQLSDIAERLLVPPKPKKEIEEEKRKKEFIKKWKKRG